MDDFDEYDTDAFEAIDGPLHLIPDDNEPHAPFTTCWCHPRLAKFCVCHQCNRGEVNNRCVMCLGTGYIDACQKTYTVAIHFDRTDRDERDRPGSR